MIRVDMSVDGPLYLEDFWNNKKFSQAAPPSFFKIPTNPTEASKEKELIEMIKKFHNLDQNCVTKDKHIIICNDYINGLYCLASVLGKTIGLNAPHNPHYFNCMSLAGKLAFGGGGQYLLNEFPNQQTLSQNVNLFKDAIFDCSYNWSLYLKKPYLLDKDIAVFSAGILLGNMSTRLGWIVVKDYHLYVKLKEFIERTQLSISAEAQQKTLHLMESVFNIYGKDFFEHGRKVHEERQIEVQRRKFPFQILNKEGLYLWCKGTCPAVIKPMLGSHFGVSNEYFRLNIAIKQEDFDLFLKIA